MHISLVSPGGRLTPRTRALLASLESVGHATSIAELATRRFGRVRLETNSPSSGVPQLLWPASSALVGAVDEAAGKIDSWVGRRPDWPRPARDLIWAIPENPGLATPAIGLVPETAPWKSHAGRPLPGRHSGRTVALAFRSTMASPGHALRRALERAGVSVTASETIDRSELTVDAVVVVESPMPPVALTGDGPAPVVFWVHHGEHHLEANVRLARRYRADLVLLAHSWHLAHRFPVRVERFPFAVDPQLVRDTPAGERDIDMAFVGSVEGDAYSGRRDALELMISGLGRVEVASNMSPEAMADLYGRSLTVLNDGGTRHLPITMRVFEAVGAGALLVSEPAPGLDLLFGGTYTPLDLHVPDVAGIRQLIENGTAAELARAARDEASKAHTYDQRVDLLFRFIDSIDLSKRPDPLSSPTTPLETFLDSHPYGQLILDDLGSVNDPTREVWLPSERAEEVPKARSFDTVVAGPATAPSTMAAARRFVIGTFDPDRLLERPRSVSTIQDLTVADMGGDGYDIQTVGDDRRPDGSKAAH